MNKKLNIQISYVYIFNLHCSLTPQVKAGLVTFPAFFGPQGFPPFPPFPPRYLFNPTHEV